MNASSPIPVFIGRLVGILLLLALTLPGPLYADSPDKYQAPSQVGLSPRSDYVVLFDPGSSRLDPRARAVLDEVVRKAHPDEVIRLVGHTDTIGDAQSNRSLSCRRALAARNYLVSAGIAPDLILIEGRGEASLAVPTGDEREYATNRRVVITLDAGPTMQAEWACDGGQATAD